MTLFYLIPPQNFETLYIPDYITSLFLIFIVESIILLWKGEFRLNFFLSCFLTYVMASSLKGIFVRNLSWDFYMWTYQFKLLEWYENKYVLWFVTFILVDFVNYVCHRASHEINLLWQLSHHIHHAPEEFTTYSAIYQPFFQEENVFVFFGSVGILGIPPRLFFAHSMLNTLYQIWVHTKTIKKLPWLFEYFVCICYNF